MSKRIFNVSVSPVAVLYVLKKNMDGNLVL